MADSRYGGRFGSKYGRKIRARVVEIEKKQRAEQECPKCGKASTRKGPGIFECPKCGKFTGGAYYVE
jgi:large subunit ribosomal protein L37Ae